MLQDLIYSIIVPVYNRPEEIRELLETLVRMDYDNFEVIIVEDGSEIPCKQEIDEFFQVLDLKYFFKSNTGPGDSRNFGANKAVGDYLIFFDSDCLVPSNYLKVVNQALFEHKLDLFGGPDKAHNSFTTTQKAINFAMTSLLTTGGIRGHRRSSSSFQPRSFNMGISKKAFHDAGGFSNLHPGEDPDLVYKIVDLGFVKGLIPEAFVYHKRRIDLKKFSTQIFKFGLARTILMKWHPGSRKFIFYLPTMMMLAGVVLLLLGWKFPVLWYIVLAGILVLLISSLFNTKSLQIGIFGVVATIVQVISYGWGFLKGWWQIHLLGKSPQQQFPFMFMGDKLENR